MSVELLERATVSPGTLFYVGLVLVGISLLCWIGYLKTRSSIFHLFGILIGLTGMLPISSFVIVASGSNHHPSTLSTTQHTSIEEAYEAKMTFPEIRFSRPKNVVGKQEVFVSYNEKAGATLHKGILSIDEDSGSKKIARLFIEEGNALTPADEFVE